MTQNWLDLFAALSELDDNDWDVEHERLKSAWLAAYAAAFISIAEARGWKQENAMGWPDEIGAEAFIESHAVGYDPQRQAQLDVVACEDPP